MFKDKDLEKVIKKPKAPKIDLKESNVDTLGELMEELGLSKITRDQFNKVRNYFRDRSGVGVGELNTFSSSVPMLFDKLASYLELNIKVDSVKLIPFNEVLNRFEEMQKTSDEIPNSSEVDAGKLFVLSYVKGIDRLNEFFKKRGLKQRVDIRGDLGQLLEDTGANFFNPTTFEKYLEEND